MPSYYQKLLRDSRWQRKRLEVFERAGFRCESCDQGEEDGIELHGHHRWYEPGKKPWEASDESLMCLCSVCHLESTKINRAAMSILNRLGDSDLMVVAGFAAMLLNESQETPAHSIAIPGDLRSYEFCEGAAIALERPSFRAIDLLMNYHRTGDTILTREGKDATSAA